MWTMTLKYPIARVSYQDFRAIGFGYGMIPLAGELPACYWRPSVCAVVKALRK